MAYRNFGASAKLFITPLMILATTTPVLAQQAGATVESVTALGGGLYRITGTALNAQGNATCALALASGRCMFTCGPGSLRCEGGTASLPFGKFDLTNLPTEANGTIVLQVFVGGNISFAGAITPSGGGGGGTARWNSYNNTCCSNSSGQVFTSTYSVTVDGVTRQSVSNSCTSSSSIESFASTTAGTKNFTSQVSSACGTASGSGTVTMAANGCYRFQLDFESNTLVNKFGTVSCPSSAEATPLQADAEATPMAIFPMLPAATIENAESPAATYQPLQLQR
ncbi:MAG: hypothetical protein P9F19_04830 [Candidatus Contendobacter sp.]|nr:hypothetical protein [Candidatus Contendobacter sp.]MDG4556702.1 hypothetical protein [Candidatus Contendobacter sp.]